MENKEYLLIMHHESGDEIHFTITDIEALETINKFIECWPEIDATGIEDYIGQQTLDTLMCQTYVLEDFSNIGKYNIVKSIYIPDLGC